MDDYSNFDSDVNPDNPLEDLGDPWEDWERCPLCGGKGYISDRTCDGCGGAGFRATQSLQ